MSDAEDPRYGAMVEFLGLFPSVSGPPPTDLAELGDGVVLFEVLSEIAPSHFDPTTIARHLGDNWALKSSNLRKLFRNLETYYHEVLTKDADFDNYVGTIPAISRNSDREAIADLFELIAAAAVTCEDKGEYVGRIMGMSSENQMHMKGIIESSLGRLTDYDGPEGGSEEGEQSMLVFGDDDGSDDDEVNVASPMNEMSGGTGLFHSPAEMSGVASPSSAAGAESLIKERDELRRALQDARRELAAHKSQSALMAEDTEGSQRKLRALAEDLQERLGRRQEELTQAEEELTKTNRALEDAEARASDSEEKVALLADDLDVANAKAAQLKKAEATVVAYRKKLESVGVMNQQMTDLEDQAAGYLRQIMELENDVKKVPSLQKNVEELQSQVSKLEKEKFESDESLKAKSSEVAKLKSEVVAAESAKKLYEEELAEVRSQQEGPDAMDDELGSAMTGLTLTSAQSVTEAKEKALRLEIENKSLKEQIEKLEQQQEETSSRAIGGGEEMKSLRAKIARLQEALKKKDAEKEKLGSDKEKLEAYTKKTLSKFQEKYLVALQECKAKLKEKHDKIEALEMRSAAEKTAQKREERLLSSTIYELGLAIMQQRLKER